MTCLTISFFKILDTPSRDCASKTTLSIFSPAIKRVTSPDKLDAAHSVFKVEPFKLLLSCSAITKIIY